MSNPEQENTAVKIQRLLKTLDKPVVLYIPKGEKGPKYKGWSGLTYEDTQQEDYQKQIMAAIIAGGNLGILLGPNSRNLVAIDFDKDEDAEFFFKTCPWASREKTMVTRGCHGCQVWFYMVAWYPTQRVILKKDAGKPTVEFRGGGGLQSVCFGVHPNGPRYTWNEKLPMQADYVDFAPWLSALQGEDYGYEREGQFEDWTWLAGDKRFRKCNLRDLSLVGLFTEMGLMPERIKEGDGNKWRVNCPWMHEHTTPQGELDSVVFQYEPRGKWFPAYRCLHAHCANRGLREVMEWAEGAQPGIVRRWCQFKKKLKLIGFNYANKKVMQTEEIPKTIIEGLLHEGSKMMIAAPAKIGKTWMGMGMGICLAKGIPWLGFDTCQSRVLYLNMEMRKPFFDLRICNMWNTMGIDGLPDNSLVVVHLRGTDEARALAESLDLIIEFCADQAPFDVIILDPLYKILGGRDENSATDVADLLGEVDRVVEGTGAAVVLIHHFAKGNPNLKAVGDRASGSGVFFRDPDVYMTISWLEEAEKLARLDFQLRETKGIESFGVRWADYQWKRDPTIFLGKGGSGSGSGAGGKRAEAGDRYASILLNILKENPTGITNGQLKNIATTTYSIPVGSFDRAFKAIKDRLSQSGKLYKWTEKV